jgi:hypothetical protein
LPHTPRCTSPATTMQGERPYRGVPEAGRGGCAVAVVPDSGHTPRPVRNASTVLVEWAEVKPIWREVNDWWNRLVFEQSEHGARCSLGREAVH